MAAFNAAFQAATVALGGTVYESVGIVSETEIGELRELAQDLRDRVIEWMSTQHPDLL